MKNFKYGHPYPYFKLPPPELLGMTNIQMNDMVGGLIEQRREYREHLGMTNDEIQEHTNRVIRERRNQRETVEHNWGYLGHGERRVFRIPIGDIPEGEIDEYVQRITNKFKTPTESLRDYVFPENFVSDFPIIDYQDRLLPEGKTPRISPELMDGYWNTLNDMRRNPRPIEKKSKINLVVSKTLRIFVSTIKNIFKWKS